MQLLYFGKFLAIQFVLWLQIYRALIFVIVFIISLEEPLFFFKHFSNCGFFEGGTTKAQWEDVTGSTPLTFVNDCVSFTTTVSARFWLIDCRQVNEATKFANELYREAIHVPFMAKFVVFAKRHDPLEAQLRVFCMTDDKEDKTLESQEHFTEVAKSRDVEVLEGKLQYLEFAGNLVPVTKSGEQLSLTFQAFRENRLPFTIRVKDPHQEPMGRVAFMREARVGRGEPPQSPICNLNIVLPEADLTPVSELVTLEKKYGFVKENSLAKPELIHRADLRVSDIAKELRDDWVLLALQLDLSESEINSIRADHPTDTTQQALAMLRHWLQKSNSSARGNLLEKGLRKINREDIVNNCMFNVELVTDDVEKAVAKVHLDQSGFDTFREELGSSRDASLRRDISLNGTYDEQDIMKDAESAAETSSESSDRGDRHAERKGRVVSETVIRSSAKVFEETPETLVQSVPSAISENYSHKFNGQTSDASIHEDQSEPTVATLSSEATAEMEVSSLDDKSQGETHIEKNAQSKCAGSEKIHKVSRNNMKPNAFESLRSIKYKQIKKNSNASKRKTISDFCNRVATLPATFNQKKLKTRRNSWPPVSPLKLTRRKKYHELIKVRDFKEPFMMNSYEWLTMKCAPEKFKVAPLAKLSEFNEEHPVLSYEDYKKKARSASAQIKRERPTSLPLPITNKLSFYFVINSKQKHALERRKYLQNLKNKCSVNMIQSLKPTNFDCLSASDKDNSFDQNDIEHNIMIEQNKIIPGEQRDIFAEVQNNFSPLRYSYYDINADSIETLTYSPYDDVPRFSRTPSPRSSLGHLHSYNSFDSLGNVLICNPTPNLGNNVLKQKVLVKEHFKDKENVKINCVGFPDSKYPEHIDKGKKNILNQSAKKSQKFMQTNEPLRSKQNLLNKCIISDPKNLVDNNQTISKQLINKSYKQDLRSCPHDIPEPKSSESKKTDSSSNQNTQPTSSSSQISSKRVDSPSDSQSSSQTNKPYLRQLFEKDIQSNYTMSSNVSKESNVETGSEKEKKSQSEKSKELETKKKQEIEEKPQIPASVLGQAFLSTLIEQTKANSSEPYIPASVIGQSFLKTLQEQTSHASAGGKPMPAEVIGQSFLKNLLSNQNISEASSEADEPRSSKKSTENVLPANVLGQAFLKSLISDVEHTNSADKSSSTKESVIPGTILGQEFLKTLIQDANKEESKAGDPKVVPAPVVGQAFLKSLVEQTTQPESQSEGTIPSSVVGQTFLKSLIEMNPEQLLEAKDVIPASVVGQTFLKSLTEMPCKDEDPGGKPVPSSVVGQSFLKSLIEQCTTDPKSESSKSEAIPAPVVGQAFLKSLIEAQSDGTSGTSENVSESSIPASVLAQTFLKSLLTSESQNVSESSPSVSDQKDKTDVDGTESLKSKVLPASVVSQGFLKSLIEEQSRTGAAENVMPASVLGQVFMKALIEGESSKCTETSIPAPVVAQSFLKSLTSECPETQSKETAVPASVIGQTFLKTLVQENAPEKPLEQEEAPIPSSVVSQAFLKSLLAQSSIVPEASTEPAIPSSVVSQAFLKSLLGMSDITSLGDKEIDSSVEPKESKDYKKSSATIPAPVVGQAFLSSLLSQASQPAAPPVPEKEAIPASVVGLAFLKTLTEQAKPASDPSTSSAESFDPKSDVKSIPANVVGQAFLRTLFSMSDSEKASQISTEPPQPASTSQIAKSDLDEDNICLNGCSTSGGMNSSFLSEEQSAIIPPPPEFCSGSEESSTASCSSSSQTTGSPKVELPSNIIEELLSCTKVMQSVIESMKETDAQQSAVENLSKTSDICNKE